MKKITIKILDIGGEILYTSGTKIYFLLENGE